MNWNYLVSVLLLCFETFHPLLGLPCNQANTNSSLVKCLTYFINRCILSSTFVSLSIDSVKSNAKVIRIGKIRVHSGYGSIPSTRHLGCRIWKIKESGVEFRIFSKYPEKANLVRIYYLDISIDSYLRYFLKAFRQFMVEFRTLCVSSIIFIRTLLPFCVEFSQFSR